jgi:isopentenyl diphosphate isomerase/L-lactate dehydrogenase-like FMN-dependent dehydrogenase
MTLAAVNLEELEALAREALEPGAYAYFAGGAGDELTIADNRAAYARLRLVPRVLRGLADRTTATTVLGRQLRFPALVAPLAYQKVAHPDGELALARAAADAGTGLCLSSLSNYPLEEVAAAAPHGLRLFQLYPYRDRAMTEEVIARAAAAGYHALVVTVDVAVHGAREREARHAFALPPDCPLPCVPVPADHPGPVTPRDVSALMAANLSWADIERFMGLTELPIVLKGILAPQDARIACELGVAGIVVSNHGGRQLDTSIATIDALPAVTEVVDGRCEVLIDGGVRRGTDVLKALALGARAALVGRPVTWGLAAGGEAGVRAVLQMLEAEIATALALAGCAGPADAGPELLSQERA